MPTTDTERDAIGRLAYLYQQRSDPDAPGYPIADARFWSAAEMALILTGRSQSDLLRAVRAQAEKGVR